MSHPQGRTVSRATGQQQDSGLQMTLDKFAGWTQVFDRQTASRERERERVSERERRRESIRKRDRAEREREIEIEKATTTGPIRRWAASNSNRADSASSFATAPLPLPPPPSGHTLLVSSLWQAGGRWQTLPIFGLSHSCHLCLHMSDFWPYCRCALSARGLWARASLFNDFSLVGGCHTPSSPLAVSWKYLWAYFMAEKSELKLLLSRSHRSLSNVDNLFRDFPAECASHPKRFIKRERQRERGREVEGEREV